MEDEDALMRRAADGDVRAFERIVRIYQDLLVRVATRLLGDAETARDAAQEAFVRLWRARAAYQGRGQLRAYLLRVVRRVCIDLARARGPWEVPCEESGEDDGGVEARAQMRALAQAVRRAVGELPEPQRAVFVLSHYEGLTYAEIARTLDCPLGTVASRKRLATEALRGRLRPWLEGEREGYNDL